MKNISFRFTSSPIQSETESQLLGVDQPIINGKDSVVRKTSPSQSGENKDVAPGGSEKRTSWTYNSMKPGKQSSSVNA